MSWHGMEPVVEAVIAALKEGLPDAIAAVNAAAGDAVTIAAPHETSYLIGISDEELESETLQLANPTVIVQGGDSLPKPSGKNPDIGGEYTVDNALTVSVLFQAPTLDRRVRMTWRYQCALNDVLLSDGEPYCEWAGSGYLEKTIPAGVWRDAICLYSATTFETP